MLKAQSILYSLEAMERASERVANGPMDRRKSQRLPDGLEAPHVAFPLPAALLG